MDLMASWCLTSSSDSVGTPLYLRILANMGFVMGGLLPFRERRGHLCPRTSAAKRAGCFPAHGHHRGDRLERIIESFTATHRLIRCMVARRWNDSTTIICSISGWWRAKARWPGRSEEHTSE